MGYFLTIMAAFLNLLLTGIGAHLVFSLGGVFFLGIPTVYKTAGYALALSQQAGLAPELALLITVSTATLCGILFAWIFARVSPDSFAVLGLASILAAEALLRSWDSVTNGILGISGIVRPASLQQLTMLVLALAGVAMGALLVEYVLLKTWAGRALRAYKENPTSVQTLGIPTMRLVQTVMVGVCFLFGLDAALFIWRIQFIDPTFFGIPTVIAAFTIGILATKPTIRSLVLATLFVAFLPELLRFFQFPSTVLGHMRTLTYSVLLMIVIARLASRHTTVQRSI